MEGDFSQTGQSSKEKNAIFKQKTKNDDDEFALFGEKNAIFKQKTKNHDDEFAKSTFWY